jgi:hypothetical protein
LRLSKKLFTLLQRGFESFPHVKVNCFVAGVFLVSQMYDFLLCSLPDPEIIQISITSHVHHYLVLLLQFPFPPFLTSFALKNPVTTGERS